MSQTKQTESRPEPADGYDLPEHADHVRCEYCGAPFADEQLLALHRGIDHEDRLTQSQREAFEAAFEAEAEDIRLFRLKALAVLVALYFALLMTYSVFT